jgi:hypothetical protein
MCCGDESLQRLPGSRPELEPVASTQTELNKARTKLKAFAAILCEVTARLQGVNKTVRATSSKFQPPADLRNRQATRVAG